MRVLLLPDRPNAYGQDFLSNAITKNCDLVGVPCSSFFELESSPDLVVTQNPDSAVEVKIIESLDSKVPVVAHVHCQFGYYDLERQTNLAKCLDRSTLGIAPAKFQERALSERFPKVGWRMVYNGIDGTRFYPSTLDERVIWRRKHGIPEDCVLVGFVGRLENAKGLQVLEEFCRLLPETKLHLLVQFLANNNAPSVSRGESIAKQLVSRNSAQVHVYRDQDVCVDRPIRHCDLMLSLSLSEVCPLTVLEALHCGIPVLATRSTPFYHELKTLGFPHHLIRILEIEGISGTSGRNLSISEDAAKRLANAYITIASTLSLSSDRDRKDTSEKIQSLGFDQQSMLGRLSAIYSQALSIQVG